MHDFEMIRRIAGEISGSTYEVVIGDLLDDIIREHLEKYDQKRMFVSSGLNETYRERLSILTGRENLAEIHDGEGQKSFDAYSAIVSSLLSAGLPRSVLLSYAGGGTLGDLIGFVSSTYKRGTSFTAIPTTLLAQVDSSIGGKNGVNLSGVKNAIGTFHLPEKVFCDTSFLNDRVISDGLSEMVKYGVIGDVTIIDSLMGLKGDSILSQNELLSSLIAKCVSMKMNVVAADIQDTKGVRSILNFGHTIGHAIESVSGNSISHGRAIAAGMIIESRMSELAEICEDPVSPVLSNVFWMIGIDVPRPDSTWGQEIMSYVRNDKKVEGGMVKLPVPLRIGRMGSLDVDLESFGKLASRAMEDLWR